MGSYKRNVSKDVYQSLIMLFKCRRHMLRRKYGYHSKEAHAVTVKIKNWNRAIKRIKAREARFKVLIIAFRDYFDTPNTFARYALCKYAIESGFKSPIIAKYLGCAKYYPSKIRRKFNRHFNDLKKEEYAKFKQFADRSTQQDD
jgi:hypothetical protein